MTQTVEKADNALEERPPITRPPLVLLGRRTMTSIAGLGALIIFSGHVIRWTLSRPPYRGTLRPTMYMIGVRSVPVVAITGTFIGMVLAVQAYGQFAKLQLENRLGAVINVSLVSELGPVLAATMLAGRIGSAMAAEIGTMKVTEQIDALTCLGTHPLHYLVVPRLYACVILIPVLTVLADFMGVIGGALVSIQMLQIDSYHYWLFSRQSVGLWEIFTGLFKTLFFGAEIALISCERGFRARAGAEGVGRAATEAFVYSFVAILATDFFLGYLINAVYQILWPVSVRMG